MTTSTPTPNSPRELAHRSSDGLDVSLLWRPADDTAYLSVLDHRTQKAMQFSRRPRRRPRRLQPPIRICTHPTPRVTHPVEPARRRDTSHDGRRARP